MPTPVDRQPVITPRGRELPEGAGIAFDAKGLARDILRKARAAVLSTLDSGSGYPFGSVTNIATGYDGTPIFFAALLAVHSRNILADSRVALTLADLGKGDALAQPRLGLVGRASLIEDNLEAAQQRYLRRHPKGKLYLALPDARMFRVTLEGVHLGAGPGRNAAQLVPADLVTDLGDAQSLIAAEAEEIAALNTDAPAIERLTRAAGLNPGKWKIIGIDPDGIDLIDGDETGRFNFDGRICTPNELRAALARI
ncbi:HugZ family protein [Dongia sp.]|uniref:HugZ family pyridoxamine 5'-phosphate oxidase n=1 Tax=Dongia sp. TaxID=1977262 RepID=UPI0035B41843